MNIRAARPEDVRAIQIVRNSVKENTLSRPELITDELVLDFLFRRGKGWVYELESQLVGFGIVDLTKNNVWALFLDPAHENKGIGRQLHHQMLEWYFAQTQVPIWLGTGPNTRAAGFYRRLGWKEIGKHGKDEIKFEMRIEDWLQSLQ